MMTSSICLITCLLAVGLPVIMGFPNGPPVDTHPELCHEMFPSGHLAQARTEGSPYEIIIGSSCYKPGLDITGETLSFNSHISLQLVILMQIYLFWAIFHYSF